MAIHRITRRLEMGIATFWTKPRSKSARVQIETFGVVTTVTNKGSCPTRSQSAPADSDYRLRTLMSTAWGRV
jgi:hypothetical protein